MTWQIVRSTSPYQVLRAPSGPRGQPAAQDVGWGPMSGGFNIGEKLNLPPLPHATAFTRIYAHSDSGVANLQTLVIHQLRGSSVVASASIELTPGASDWSAVISGAGLVFQVADVPQLVLPDPADPQLSDLSVSLGSTP